MLGFSSLNVNICWLSLSSGQETKYFLLFACLIDKQDVMLNSEEEIVLEIFH